MAIRNIVTEEDPILRKKSRVVDKFNEKLWMILDDMKDTMYKAEGVGLAAVQVGLLRRVVVVDVGDGTGPLELVNPEIVSADGEQEGQEGCLSLPNKWAIVKRPDHVVIKAQDRLGRWHRYEAEGLKARCFCHEIDHLDGHLFTDRMEKMLTEEEVRRLQAQRQQGSE